MKIIENETEITAYIKKNLANYYKTEKLIPLLGAGFTKGSKAKRGNVPDAKECVNLMKELILNERADLRNDVIDIVEFDKIANIFYKVVSTQSIVDFLYSNFTNVYLAKEKNEFINLKWRFIYTLNVDDAIERNSRYLPILPNKKLYIKNINSNQNVYKLHGDANDEITYIKEKGGIIFSRKQYIQSLKENSDLLNIFFEDYSKLNIILIGCSLDNEIDLEYIFANSNLDSPTKTDKIYVTTSVPPTLKKMTLEEYGINICLVINNYDKFYRELISEFNDASISKENALERFIIKKCEKDNDFEYNRDVICSIRELLILNNKIKLPSFFGHRKTSQEIIKNLANSDMIFLIGKRVSGKTFVLYDLADKVSNTTVYLFSSKISLDSDIIDRISKIENAIMLFDTDTISSTDIEEIYYDISTYNKNNVKFVFCINSSDKLMLSIPYSRLIDVKIFELDNKFDREESIQINTGLSKLGITKVQEKENIISNILRLKDIYKIPNNYSITTDINPKSLKIYILNATFDKVYSSMYRALKIDYDNLKYTIDKSERSMEFEFDLSVLEYGQHANYKVITNSKLYLFNSLGTFISKHQNLPNAVNAIVEIVQSLMPYDNFKNQWKTLITFDTLNQIFLTNSRGAMNLIFQTYNSLETLLYKETHYWLQRAKSIYYLKGTIIDELLKAIIYTKKSYHDSPDDSRMKTSSSFQLAMIYNRLLVQDQFSNTEYLSEGIKWISIGLKENMHNTRFIADFIQRAKNEKFNNDFYSVAMFVLNNPKKFNKDDRDLIINKLLNS
jgi:hypothetical protein